MMTNEELKKKSKFVYGTKMSRGTCFVRGWQYAMGKCRKNMVDIDKACAWLEENFIGECGYLAAGTGTIHFNTKPAVEAFRKAMEE